MIKILYLDDDYVVVHKPAGLLVHRSSKSSDRIFLLQELRNQLGIRIFPVHRLDRPTSGVIVFALNQEAARSFSEQIQQHKMQKEYWAIVRGYTDEFGVIDYPISANKEKVKQEAVTNYSRLAIANFNIPCDRYPTSRYSLIQCFPKTGRYHQIRKHCAHISHHIIGDTMHGNGNHNRIFREEFGLNRLMLIAKSIEFYHPGLEKLLKIETSLEEEFQEFLTREEWIFSDK